jgi:hypothetical protein
MESSTNSAEKPAIQGTQRCNGRFLFLAKEESLNPFVAAEAPNKVVCIGVNPSRLPPSGSSTGFTQLFRRQNPFQEYANSIGEHKAKDDKLGSWTKAASACC